MSDAPNWQPIETAPKDGQPILAFWPDCYGNDSNTIVKTWWEVTCYPRNRWHTSYDFSAEGNEPTHWMPLPEPPRQDKGE